MSNSASRLSGARCVVTGGLGFIGSNLVLALHAAGALVTVVDSLVPRHGGNRRNLDGLDITTIVADIADSTAVADAIGHAEFVFNLAGQVSHLDSMEDPIGDLDLNTRSHLSLLELLRRVNPNATIVYTSTRQVYGRPLYSPVAENHPIQPVDVNGVTKYATEQLHLLYASAHGMRASALRLTNVYGPRQRLVGDRQGFLPIFIRLAIEDQPITVYGDGSQERDCVYVDDVVDAIVAAALSNSASGRVFNLGNDPLTLLSIANTIVAAAGAGSVKTVIWPPERARIDIGSYHGDFSRARDELGWSPTVGFEDGIATTVAFYREHLDWYL